MKKTLMLLVVLSLLVSFSATLWSLQYIAPTEPSGYITNNQTGNMSLVVLGTLSITADDDVIAFGTCVPNTTRGYTQIDSNLSSTGVNNDECVDGTFPDFFAIRNDGNIGLNLTVSSNVSGTTFFNDSDSWLAVKTNDNTSSCSAGLQSTYINFTIANVSLESCGTLTNGGSVYVSIRGYINASVTQGGSVGLTFSASYPS